MDSHHEAPTEPIVGRPDLTSTGKNTPTQPYRTRRGNPLLSFLLFLLGIMLGILATLLFILFIAHDRAPISTPVSTQAPSLTVQLSSNYLTQLVSSKLKTAGMSGDISNVQVTLTNDNQIVINGDDRFSLPFVSIARPFTLTLQPYIQSCQAHVHLIHADVGNIPVTDFVQRYEDQINQEIQLKAADLPSSFTYCAVNVHTQQNALSIMYSATPA
ncbi:MAG: hypothetical protein NVS4B12_08810 [Ktedonobacteraceae bacterium]